MNAPRVNTCALLLVLTATVIGCASAGGMRTDPLDAGVSRTFAGSYDQVLRAARDATVGAGLAVDSFEEIDSTTAMIVAKKSSGVWSWGELVRVVVQQVDTSSVVVRVHTKRRVATNVAAKGDYSENIFQNIELNLK